ncbi:MAG: hypothetical protein IJG08_01015, partial [Oscillospiraceae bacterium]|nr:hypothetical protein [Oscillospiraceae bacterium]
MAVIQGFSACGALTLSLPRWGKEGALAPFSAPALDFPPICAKLTIQKLLQNITEDFVMFDKLIAALREGRKTIVFTEGTDHRIQ